MIALVRAHLAAERVIDEYRVTQNEGHENRHANQNEALRGRCRRCIPYRNRGRHEIRHHRYHEPEIRNNEQSHGGVRFQPKSSTPKKVASRKKAVRTSYPIMGPTTLPATSEKRLQFEPNSYDIGMPDTTPMAKETAKILVQNRATR